MMIDHPASRVSPRRARYFSLLVQRKVPKRNDSRIRRPALRAGTLCCSAQAGCAETRPAGSDICAPISARACATRLLITAWSNPQRMHCAVVRMFEFTAVEAGLSSAAAGGSGLALSERSEFSQTPPDASSARDREADLTSARLLFAYFLLAKQEKVSRPPGRDPACMRA